MCIDYEDADTCKECFGVFGISSDGKQCISKVSGCKKYETESLCAECKNGTLSSDKKSCDPEYSEEYENKLEISLICSILMVLLIL